MGESEKLDVLQGTLDLLILRTLQWGPQHGHGIGQVIRAKSDDLLQVEHGSPLPRAPPVEARGLDRIRMGTTQNNQRAKFYRLTAKGRATDAGRDEMEALRQDHGASHAAAGGNEMDQAVAGQKAGRQRTLRGVGRASGDRGAAANGNRLDPEEAARREARIWPSPTLKRTFASLGDGRQSSASAKMFALGCACCAGLPCGRRPSPQCLRWASA